jgi:hypothetical protein
MSTPRTAILAAIDAATNVLRTTLPGGQPGLDLCPSTVTIRTRVWSGGKVGLGTTSDTDLVLPNKFFLRQVTTRDIDNSGGRYEAGDLMVSGIVPNDPANGPTEGFSEAQLAPVGAEGTEIIYFITGQHEGQYTRVALESVDPFEYRLVLSRLRTTPQVTGPATG